MTANHQDNQYDIAIVGGGMVGATLACLIRDCGQRVVLLDAASEPDWDAAVSASDYSLRVSALGLAAESILRTAGIWPRLTQADRPKPRHFPYSRMVVWDACGSGRIEFTAAEANTDHLGHLVENRMIQASAWQELRESDVQLLPEMPVQAFKRKSEGGWTLALSNGETLHTSLLIGADGARSRVRAAADIHSEQRDYGQQGLVATIRTERQHADTAWQRFLVNGPLALLPLDAKHCSIVWSTTDAEAHELLALSDADFSAKLTEVSDQCLGSLQVVSERLAFPLTAHHATDYVQPQLALVGDAAHSIHPLAGQGVNLGLKDADALARIIVASRAKRGIDTADLRRYARARKLDNMAMLGLTDAFAKVSNNGNRAMRQAMNTGMNLAQLTAPLKRYFASQALS